MNQCIHGIDLLRWMMGDEVEEVYGATCQQFHDYLEAEDVGRAVVKFRNGAIGTIEGSVNVSPKNLEETLYLFGETGTVKIGGTSTNDIDVWDFAEDVYKRQAFGRCSPCCFSLPCWRWTLAPASRALGAWLHPRSRFA